MNLNKLNDDVAILIYKILYADVLNSINNLKKSYVYFTRFGEIVNGSTTFIHGYDIRIVSKDLKKPYEYSYVERILDE